MRKKIVFIITYACVALLGGIGLLILLVAPKDSRASEKENRMLSGFPELTAASLRDGSFMAGLEDYLSDAMFDRDGVIDATSRISGLFSVNDEGTDLEAEVAAFAGDTEEADEKAQPEQTLQGKTASTEQTKGETASTEQTQEQQTEQVSRQSTAVPGQAEESREATSGFQEAYSVEETPSESDGDAELTEEETEYNPIEAVTDADGWGECAFWRTDTKGKTTKVYSFSVKNMKNAVKVLNAYRAILPEDGRMYFAQIPFSATGLSMMRGEYVSWGCNIEEMLRSHVDDGVVIVSATDVLLPHCRAGEYLYFHTDHHWTPRAASYLVRAFMDTQGIPSLAYEDYRYKTYTNFYGSYGKAKSVKKGVEPDVLELLIPSLPTESYTIDAKGNRKKSYYMEDRNSYTGYLGGCQSPWRQFETGARTDRNCLVIGDSYSYCFIPFLMPYYDNVFSVDMRKDYFSLKAAGCKVTKFVNTHGIDDIFFVPSTASSINSYYMLKNLWKYL